MTSEQEELKQKIGQMLLIGFDGQTIEENSPIVDAIQNAQIGGVILFDVCLKTKGPKNIVSREQVAALNQSLRQYSAHQALPLLIAVDYEGGKVNRLKEQYGYPKTYKVTELVSKGPTFAEEQARQMAQTLASSGFNLDFAPVVDVNVIANNPIIGMLDRSFSSDATVVAEYAAIFHRAFRQAGIFSCDKHFPGHGSSLADSHLGFVDVTDTWQAVELEPYRNTACDMIMTAHIINRQLDPSGKPATLSKLILTDLLRNQLNYQGVIITDDMQMKAISAEFDNEEAMVMAVNAGADMFIYGNQLSDTPAVASELVEILYSNVMNGRIPKARIDDAYQRIVKMKTQAIS